MAKYAIIFDIDGTLVNPTDAPGYKNKDKGQPNKDTPDYATWIRNAPAVPWVVRATKEFRNVGIDIFICTARPEILSKSTVTWLKAQGIPLTSLFMRKTGDERKDQDVKQDMLHIIQSRGYTVLLAFENDKPTYKMYKDEEIPVVYIKTYN